MSNTIKAFALSAVLGGACVAGTILPVAAYAAPASTETAIKNLNQLLSNAQSMTANFSQTTKAGKKTSVFSGTMAVERGNKFRWDTKSPAEQLIVANGGTMWIYDKDLSQVIKQSTANQVGDTPALLLSGDPAKIAKSFAVSQPNSAKNYFLLKPKGNANFRELYISFNGGKPVLMVLNDSMGQQTQIRFSNITLNKKIPANQFSFTPPKGVEVIQQ